MQKIVPQQGEINIKIKYYKNSLNEKGKDCLRTVLLNTNKISKHMVCCLVVLEYNSKVSIEKEKIEIDAQSNFNQNNQ